MGKIRSFHRQLGAILAVFLIYIAATGTLTQLTDLKTIVSHAPADDPEMIAIRESQNGPSNFSVIDTPDYTASPVPPEVDLVSGIARTAAAARATLGGAAPISYVELRETAGHTVSLLKSGNQIATFNAADGTMLSGFAAQPFQPNPPSWHLWFKNWHRLFALGDGIQVLNTLIGLGLGVMTVLGLTLYLQLYRVRSRMGRDKPFWSAGGWARTGHRGIALVASAWLLVVAVSGTILSVDSLSLAVYRLRHPDKLVMGTIPEGMVNDYSSPLDPAALANMTRRVLKAYHASEADTPIKVLRLRIFSGMPQGVIVTGGAETRQLVYNADTGAKAAIGGEPGYPDTAFLLNWEWHQRMKQIHRGDFFGLPGRLLDLFSGLSVLFLSVSALLMLRKPRKAKRKAAAKGQVDD